MKILLDQNVFDAALERIRYLFDEFPHIVVGMSGGKDSTVVYELVLRVARERKRLPLTVFFLDQEAEWTATIDYVREVMHKKYVKPLWMQMPIHLDNAASFTTKFLQCWDPKERANWCHEQDPVSIKENTYGTDRFAELFPAIFKKEYAGQKVACISGVRCEESPNRLMGLTGSQTYNWITWGKKLTPGHYTFYPLYDWSWTDIWKAIHSEKWAYNKIYDLQYRYGVQVSRMRVSNLHHETAVHSLFHLQEMDPPLYEKLAKRLPGVDTAGKFGQEFYAKKLPFMFGSWCEYRDYLIEKLVDDPKWEAQLRKRIAQWDELLAEAPADKERGAAAIVNSILCNDYTGTKVENFRTAFIEKFRQDAADSMKFVNGRISRASDPLSFVWFENKFKGITGIKGYRMSEENGRKIFTYRSFRYWLEDADTLCRAPIETQVAACQ